MSTQALAEFAAATTYDDLPAPVIEDAKLAILDWFGSMLAGALEPPAGWRARSCERLGIVGRCGALP